MRRGLWGKFLLLLIGVTAVGLSATFLLRELMVKDFRGYLEGEHEDRVYWITAALESSYERYSGWNTENLIENAVWALLLGIELEVLDRDGARVIDTATALERLTPFMAKRVTAITERRVRREGEEFRPYALFLGGEQIGVLEVRFLIPHREQTFISRSNRFLLLSLLALGGVAVFLSVFFSRRMTHPLKELTAAAADVADGNLRRRVAIARDDEIGALADTFNRMAFSLETQEALRKRLTSTVAHELRTPVSAIRGEIEGMMDGLISADKESLQSLYAEIGRLKNILDGIEELSHAEASGIMLRKQEVRMRPFLRNIQERFGMLFMDKGISLELSCDERATAKADPDKLSQVVINLLSNAMRATPKGGKVEIRVFPVPSGTRIEVADTGKGIRAEDLPFIFERFFRGPEGGLGIGLAVVRELVEAHGGRIEAQSEYGKGSTFTLFLPTERSS